MITEAAEALILAGRAKDYRLRFDAIQIEVRPNATGFGLYDIIFRTALDGQVMVEREQRGLSVGDKLTIGDFEGSTKFSVERA